VGKVVDITGLIKDLEALNNAEDYVLIDFLNAIKEYSELLLSDEDITTKLLKSLHMLERVNPLFLNKYLFLNSEDFTDDEKNFEIL